MRSIERDAIARFALRVNGGVADETGENGWRSFRLSRARIPGYRTGAWKIGASRANRPESRLRRRFFLCLTGHHSTLMFPVAAAAHRPHGIGIGKHEREGRGEAEYRKKQRGENAPHPVILYRFAHAMQGPVDRP